jgi:hypothetical protein
MNINDQTRFNQFYRAYLNELTLQDLTKDLTKTSKIAHFHSSLP